jgi:hypothetical protein
MQDVTGGPECAPTAGYSLREAAGLLGVGATLTPIVAPLVAELAASRQTIERQAERVAELEREYGRLSAQFQTAVADAVAAKTHATVLTAELERNHADLRPDRAGTPPAPILVITISPGLQRWLRWAAFALVMAIVAATLGLLLFVLPPLDKFM